MTDSSPNPGGPEEAPTLNRRSARGGLIVVVAAWVQMAIVMGATMTMARILTPADFGILAMATIVIGFIESFRDFGLSSALVHEEDLKPEQADGLFRLGLKLNGLLALAALLFSAIAALFFEEARVIPVVGIITIGVFARGISVVHGGLLERELQFGAVAATAIASEVVAASVGIGLALSGFGFWSLAVQQAVALVFRAIGMWVISGWKPRLTGAEVPSLGHMRRYGAQTTIVRTINQLTESFDRMLVGRMWDKATLGLYQAARRWSEIAPTQVVAAVKPVAVATFSRLRSDGPSYRATARDLFEASLIPTLALLAYLVADAEHVVLLLLGDQWLDAIPAFRFLGAGMFMGTIWQQMAWVYLAEGRTDVRLRWIWISRPIYLAMVGVGSRWGFEGIAAAVALAYTLMAGPAVWFALRGSPLAIRDYWAAWWRPAITALVTGGAVHALLRGIPETGHPFVDVAVSGTAFALIYFLSWCALPGGWLRIRDLLVRAKASLRRE